MKAWLRRVAAALGMGLAWAAVWAPLAVLAGFMVDPDDSMDEMWVAVGAYPGFLCGVIFSVVLATAWRAHRLHDLSPLRAGALGALAGLLVGLLPFIMGTPTTTVPRWLLMSGVVGAIGLLATVSGALTPAAVRMAKRKLSWG